MNAYLLETLYVRLGSPIWFWPVVFALLLSLFVLGGSIAPECLS